MLRDGLRLVEQREAENAARLAALCEAATTGIAALDSGAFKELPDTESLTLYLNE